MTLVFVDIQEMDVMTYMWRENTTLRRWNIKRVAFMSAPFCLQLNNAYCKFYPNKKAYDLPNLFLAFGRGELPSHGRTDKVWGVDIDRLCFPLFVNCKTPCFLYTSPYLCISIYKFSNVTRR